MGKIFLGGIAFIAILLFFTIFGAFYTVDAGERAVILRNGAISGVSDPGLHFKLPFVDTATDISVRQATIRFDQVQSYSADQQVGTMVLSVNYHLPADKIAEIYSQFGGEQGVTDRIIYPKVQEQLKNVFGKFTAATAIQDRPRLNAEVQTAIKSAAEASNVVIIDAVQIENVDFSDAYENAVDDRMLAEVNVAKLKQNALQEKINAEIAVTKAQGLADSNLAVATANAKAIKLNGEAEAYAIEARGKALQNNPSVVALTTAEKWNGQLPATMLPGSSVPFIDVGKTIAKE